MATYQAINACTWRKRKLDCRRNDYCSARGLCDANHYENVGAMLFDLASIRNTYANFIYIGQHSPCQDSCRRLGFGPEL
jgi:hypothetical protein